MGSAFQPIRLLLTLVIAFPAFVCADSITLKDGSQVEGDLKRNPDGSGWTITTADGKVRSIAADAVKSVQLGSNSAGGTSAAEGLASLRRSVDAVADISQIIERYQRFINATTDATVLADAKADLNLWRQRRDQGLVKLGTKWVPPAEVAAIRGQVGAMADQARDLIRQNRNREADQVISQAMAVDPQNPAANYLRGVILFRQDKISDARKYFEIVNTAAPNHPPTLNNLAVIIWRQNQHPAALNYYDLAMQAAGVNEYILNNVAEALGSLTDDQRKGTAVARSLRRFAELDQLLQQRKAQEGLYRWGSSFIGQKQMDDLRAAEKEARQKLESMQAEFDQSRIRIGQIDIEVQNNESEMNNIRLNSLFRDAAGNVFTIPLPQSYFDLQRQNQLLRAEQESLRTKMVTLQDQVKHVQESVPVPRFTGVQQIVGVEGMPELETFKPETRNPNQ